MSQEQMDSPLLRNSTASRIVDSIFEVVKRSEVVIVGRSTCEHTIGARMLLDEFGISHEDIDIDRFAAYDEVKEMMTSRTKGHDTTPWVFLDHAFLGGEDSLRSALMSGTSTAGSEIPLAVRQARRQKAEKGGGKGGEDIWAKLAPAE